MNSMWPRLTGVAGSSLLLLLLLLLFGCSASSDIGFQEGRLATASKYARAHNLDAISSDAAEDTSADMSDCWARGAPQGGHHVPRCYLHLLQKSAARAGQERVPMQRRSQEASFKGKPGNSAAHEYIEYHSVAHHKTGTVEAESAARFMTEEILSLSEQPLDVLIDAPWDTLGLAINPAMLHRAKPSCMAHFTRNPFEILVSGYLYHKAGSEHWLLQSFSSVQRSGSLSLSSLSPESCHPDFKNGQMSGLCKEIPIPYWQSLWNDGLARIYTESREGVFADLLPDAKPDENLPEYLNRVDPDAGLVAQFIWAYNTTFAPMQFTHSYIQSRSQSCSLNVCYKDFIDNCNATWHRILQTWQVEEPQRSALFRGAAKSCPDAQEGAMSVDRHSTRSKMEKAGIKSEPEYKLMSRARKLDKVYMHESLATLEHDVGCTVTDKYAEPSSADH